MGANKECKNCVRKNIKDCCLKKKFALQDLNDSINKYGSKTTQANAKEYIRKKQFLI